MVEIAAHARCINALDVLLHAGLVRVLEYTYLYIIVTCLCSSCLPLRIALLVSGNCQLTKTLIR